jgi:hypothetical protein
MNRREPRCEPPPVGWKYAAVFIGYYGAAVHGCPGIDKITEVSDMSAQELVATAKTMVAEGKGL